MENKQFLDQVKTLIQVGDISYLDTLLSKNKLTTASHFSKLLTTLQAKEDFNLAHHLCKSGNLDTLNYFKRKVPKD